MEGPLYMHHKHRGLQAGGSHHLHKHSSGHAQTRTLCLDSLIVVWVNTDTVTLQVECVLAEFGMAELILVEIRPAPYPSIDHMRKPFSTSHLCMYECVECVCMWMCGVHVCI